VTSNANAGLKWPVLLCVVLISVGLQAKAASGAPAITLEDLQDALDRGDLSQSEYDLLAAMVQERLQADSVELARLSRQVSDAAPPATAGGAHGRARLALYAPLRGPGTYGQDLQLLPVLRGIAALVYARRVDSQPWYVTRASAQAQRGPLQVQAGSLDFVWTGGLLVGRSPVITEQVVPGIDGLWQPGRSRLRGVRARLATGRADAEAFGSTVSDALWQHRAMGARLGVDIGTISIEPAVLAQCLSYRLAPAAYSSTVWGLSATARRQSTTVSLNSAVIHRTLAFQVAATGRARLAHWEMDYWAIPPGFRQPLLQARGEPDREWVDYPELGKHIPSASTGESGGRVCLRSGGSRTFGEVSTTVWREQPLRPAAVRIEAVAQRTRGRRTVRVEYLHLLQPDLVEFEGRHEARVLARYSGISGELRGKWTRSPECPKGAAGGRIAGGLRVNSVGRGQWQFRAAWDAYDLDSASRQFVTLRIDHSLPLRRGELGVHLRWRSAYASHVAAWSLSIDSSVYL
jgi:hypothetical protein